MKVFVPMPDEALENDQSLGGELVPFNPEFLEPRAEADRRPSNWLTESDYASACARLRVNGVAARV